MSRTHEKSIFLAALEKETPGERAAFLAEACGGDESLRAEIEQLIDAHERPQHPLDFVPAGVDAVRDRLAQQADSHSDASRPAAGNLRPETVDDCPICEQPGTVIGPYTLREQVGEGGFGLVFVAEQQQPVRRKVALKVIKPGMDSRDVIARFEAERQALALMDHPNIARVLDAGATDTGRPYFVMELVRGIPITDFCDQSELSTYERLGLFATVCHAVQHAHQKGIIHRDIKPSNVLVTLHDGTPVVKVIDFGVAKAIGQQLTDKTIYTRFAQIIGTPLYMSPEQAEMSGLDVDTRSDIYALGVLLYELLTGTTPFDRERLHSAGFDEIRRIIREEEPPRPSARLTTLGKAITTVAALRKIEPRKLSALIRGDLDWIVMKSIEKDRSRRYETAAELAADIQRFLNERPVEARPPSPLYRFRKFARRNKVAITTASLVAATLVIGTATSAWQAARATAERDAKERARVDAVTARNEANEARKNVEEFAERLKQANVLLASGRSHASAARWPAANFDYTQATELEANYYLVWVERASLYVRLGLWELAAADYSKAFELGAPTNNLARWGAPQLFLFTGDQAHYREICRAVLQPISEASDDFVASEIRSCVVAPIPDIDPAALVQAADQLVVRAQSPGLEQRPGFPFRPPPMAWHPRNDGKKSDDRKDENAPPHPERPGNRQADGDRPPFDGPPRDGPREIPAGGPRFGPNPIPGWYPRGAILYVAGLASYRSGDFERAVTQLRDSRDLDPGWPGREIAWPALAMAYFQTGNREMALETLAQAERTIDQWIDEMLQGPLGMTPIPWFDWIECLILYREARSLITGINQPADPRLRTLELRGLAALRDGN